MLDRVEAISGRRPHPCAALTLLAWMRRVEPERFDAIGQFLLCKDWIRYRLAGVTASDPTDASTAFTEAGERCYSSNPLTLLGIGNIAALNGAMRL